MKTVRTFPELSLAALAKHRDVLLRVWYIARALDTNGVGWVNPDDLKAYCIAHCIASAPTLRRLLKRGDGDYWARVGSRLYLTSALKLAQALDCAPLRWCVAIPAESFERLATFRAALVESHFARKGTHIIAQSTLAGLTGRTRPTINKYLKGVPREKNAILTRLTGITEELRDTGHFLTFANGQKQVAKRMPNRYHTTLVATGWGQHRQHEVRQARRVFYAQGVTPRRLYFDCAGAGARAINRLGDGESAFVALGMRDTLGHTLFARYDHWDAIGGDGGITNRY